MTFLAVSLALAGQTPAIQLSPPKVIEGLRPIAIAAAPTGSKVIVSMEDGTVRVMDAKTRSTVRPLARHPQAAYAVAWSRDGSFVATGDESARIWIESPLTGKKIREFRTHTKGIQKVSFNLNGDELISTGKDDQVNVYDLESSSPKQARTILGKGTNFYGATFMPKQPYLFFVGMLNGDGARCYDSKSGNTARFLVDKGGQGIFDVAFNPSGTRAVTAERDGTAIEWDVKTSKPIGHMKGHTDWVVFTAFSPNGKLIATGSSDGSTRLWNAATLASVAEIKGPTGVGSPVCFTSDGANLVSVNEMGFLQFQTITPKQAPTDEQAKAAHKPRRKHSRH